MLRGYHVILEDLGQRVRSARLRARLTQENAAAEAKIDWRRWQRIEEGTANVTVKTLVRVAAALGIDFWQLISEPPATEEKPKATR